MVCFLLYEKDQKPSIIIEKLYIYIYIYIYSHKDTRAAKTCTGSISEHELRKMKGGKRKKETKKTGSGYSSPANIVVL